MYFKMFLNSQLIESVPILASKINSGYLESIRMDLEEKHEEIIDLSQEEPQYCIDNIPSAMNHQKNLKN